MKRMGRFLVVAQCEKETIHEIVEVEHDQEAVFRVQLKYVEKKDLSIEAIYELGQVNHMERKERPKEEVGLTITLVESASEYLDLASESREGYAFTEDFLDAFEHMSGRMFSLTRLQELKQPTFFVNKLVNAEGVILKEKKWRVQEQTLNLDSLHLELEFEIDPYLPNY